jgi:hypothetical protein
MLVKGSGLLAVLLSGVLLFIGCPTDSDDTGGGGGGSIDKNLFADDAPGLAGTAALASVDAAGAWQTLDGLTGATLLRVSRSEFGFVRKGYDDAHHLNVVDVADPAKTAREKVITGEDESGRQVLQWTTDNHGRIAAVSSKAIADAANAEQLIVYNEDLSVLKRFDFPVPAETGHSLSVMAGESAPVKLALSEDYAITGWREYTLGTGGGGGGGGGGTTHTGGLLIGSLATGKTGNISLDVLGGDTATDIVGVVTKGNFAIISNGSNHGAGVYQINASGAAITLEEVAAPDDTKETAWLLTNGTYVLETCETGAWMRIWKWNGSTAPTAVGIIDGLDGTVRAVTFDSADPAIAYHLDRTTREISRIDLAVATRTKLFKFSEYDAGANAPMSGENKLVTTQSVWNIQKETLGGADYYVLGGGLGSNQRNNGGVFVLKNPPTDGTTDIKDSVATYLQTATSWLNFTTVGSVRSTRTFVAGSNTYYVAKSLVAPYALRVVKINR